MKKSIFIFLFALLGILSARAYDFEVDGIYYNFISETDQVEVTYIASGLYYSGSVVIPSTVTYSGENYRVTAIGKEAFALCGSLTSVTIPESVTFIAEFAFYGCTGLTSVTIPESVTKIDGAVFYGCTGLTSVTIPESVTKIGNAVFEGCTGLTSITSMSEIPPFCVDNAFASNDYCEIPLLYVPAGSKMFYAVAPGWRSFAKIVELDAKTYTVTVQPGDADMGMVTGGGEYKEGERVMLVAIPNKGYYFDRWDDGNTNNPRTLTITKDTTITAIFAKDEMDAPVVYTVTARPNDADMGMVTGGGEYKDGGQALLVAIPNKGYYFARWDDGNTNNPRILTVSGDTTITAIFEKDSSTPTANENFDADNFRVYVQDRTICLSEYRGLVQVYNMAGQCVYNGHSTAIPVQLGGVYVLVSNGKRFKVAVR